MKTPRQLTTSPWETCVSKHGRARWMVRRWTPNGEEILQRPAGGVRRFISAVGAQAMADRLNTEDKK